MIALLRLCRLYYTLPLSLAYLLTVYYARGGEMPGRWAGDALSAAAVALVIAAAYAFNDFCDAEFDRLNAPHRPIPAGGVSRRAAGLWAASLLAAGLALAAACRPAFLLALTAVAAGLVLYDLFSKRLGLAKQLIVAALTIGIYPLALAQAGGAVGARAWSLAAFPAWLFPTAFGYELLKDLRDVAGDGLASPRPSALQRRALLWRRVAAAAVVLAAPGLIAPALLGCKRVYLAGALVGIAAAVASAFAPIRRAISLVYAECFLIAVAAALDAVLMGF